MGCSPSDIWWFDHDDQLGPNRINNIYIYISTKWGPANELTKWATENCNFSMDYGEPWTCGKRIIKLSLISAGSVF